MNNISSLDKFYLHIGTHIDLVSSYTENEAYRFIITSCRLKPYSFIFDKFRSRLVLHRHWIDEYGNSFLIGKDKKAKVVANDLTIEQDKLICTDLFGALPIHKIAKISKTLFFIAGKDEDNYEDCFIFAFLGLDGYLRCFYYAYEKWSALSPLLLDLEVLEIFSRNQVIRDFKEVKLKKNVVFPCLKREAVITSWPPSKNFISILEAQNSALLSILT